MTEIITHPNDSVIAPPYASQEAEDQWIDQHWDELELPDYGFFVEFGAGDGVYLSNTYWLEKAKGWHGILCEPDPRNEITDRPNSIVERVAIGPPGTVQFGRPKDPYLSGTLRTTDSTHKVVRAQDTIEVEQVPLTDILAKYGILGVDLLSIDTEGTELEAWRTLNLKRWRPRIVIIEYETWGQPSRKQETIEAFTAERYKQVHETTFNLIFKDARCGERS